MRATIVFLGDLHWQFPTSGPGNITREYTARKDVMLMKAGTSLGRTYYPLPKTGMFRNGAACVNGGNHQWCLEGIPSNLLENMCERG